MTAFVRDGRVIPVTDLRYRLYVRVRCASYPLRLLRFRIGRLLKRVAGKKKEET